MSNLNFSDGVSVKTDGPLRRLKLKDGWYVVGEGCMIPCADSEDATKTLEEMKNEKES